jgi:hypothetical protein
MQKNIHSTFNLFFFFCCYCRCTAVVAVQIFSQQQQQQQQNLLVFVQKKMKKRKKEDHHLLLLRMSLVYWGQFGRSYNRTIPQGACPRDGKKKERKYTHNTQTEVSAVKE